MRGWVGVGPFKESAHDRPEGFGFLIRPTQKELHAFLLLLDQLMGDDLNRDFFNGIEMAEKATTESGRTITVPKGTIQALQEWIDKSIRFNDPKPKDEMLKAFRDIRKLRQKPAHKYEKDVFDEEICETQRETIISAYGAVRTLRLMIANHPKARSHKVPRWLQEAKIWTQ